MVGDLSRRGAPLSTRSQPFPSSHFFSGDELSLSYFGSIWFVPEQSPSCRNAVWGVGCGWVEGKAIPFVRFLVPSRQVREGQAGALRVVLASPGPPQAGLRVTHWSCVCPGSELRPHPAVHGEQAIGPCLCAHARAHAHMGHTCAGVRVFVSVSLRGEGKEERGEAGRVWFVVLRN